MKSVCAEDLSPGTHELREMCPACYVTSISVMRNEDAEMQITNSSSRVYQRAEEDFKSEKSASMTQDFSFCNHFLRIAIAQTPSNSSPEASDESTMRGNFSHFPGSNFKSRKVFVQTLRTFLRAFPAQLSFCSFPSDYTLPSDTLLSDTRRIINTERIVLITASLTCTNLSFSLLVHLSRTLY